ncbi:MAG: sugar ABC transporter substrate-binding protein [Spirochaetales bacterium]|nr:sugar ABC transporter substrate-binding protein [Spirochaetales bacterium]
MPLFSEDNSLTVVFCNDGYTNPYHVEWLAGFETALAAYNNAFGDVQGYWRGASRVEDQLAQLEEELEKDVDILFVNAISSSAVRPLMIRAREKGIVWVSVHNYEKDADYNFLLGDLENGYNQGLALATYFNGSARIAIMLGARGMSSGEKRLQGIQDALSRYPGIQVLAQEPADWDTAKALRLAEKWYDRFPDLDAISAVTDSYLYPAMEVARDLGRDNLLFFGYDGDKAILERMKNNGPVKADVLLSATREGWNFVYLAYLIHKGFPVEKDYNFYTPLVLGEDSYRICRENGFPEDIKVFSVEQAMQLAEEGYIEYGPDAVRELLENQ